MKKNLLKLRKKAKITTATFIHNRVISAIELWHIIRLSRPGRFSRLCILVESIRDLLLLKDYVNLLNDVTAYRQR